MPDHQICLFFVAREYEPFEFKEPSVRKNRLIILVIVLAFLFAPLMPTIALAKSPVALQGLSTDTKPTYVAPGSTFYCTDTTTSYTLKQYPDSTLAWVTTVTGSATTFYLATLASNQEATITATAAELNNMHNNTSTAAELSVLHNVVAGTASASSAAVLGANKNLDTLVLPVSGLKIGSGAGTAVTASAAEINNATGEPASITTTATPASGTNTVQFVFKDAQGVQLTRAWAGIMYLSSSTGLAISSPQTSFAVATNGAVAQLVAGQSALVVTTATGLLGVTLTAASAGYYVSFILPTGKIVTSSVLTVN